MSGCLGAIISIVLWPFRAFYGGAKWIFIDLPLAVLKGFFHGITLGLFDTSKPRQRRSRGRKKSNYSYWYKHYRKMGYSAERARSNAQTLKGCFVATAVYGSYDCPEVWTLRRYRDTCLASTWYGRAFIRTYYAISPTLVRLFGSALWFQCAGRAVLNRFVRRLNGKGFSSMPYTDRD